MQPQGLRPRDKEKSMESLSSPFRNLSVFSKCSGKRTSPDDSAAPGFLGKSEAKTPAAHRRVPPPFPARITHTSPLGRAHTDAERLVQRLRRR